MIMIVFSVVMRVWQWVRTRLGHPPEKIDDSIFNYSEEENEE